MCARCLAPQRRALRACAGVQTYLPLSDGRDARGEIAASKRLTAAFTAGWPANFRWPLLSYANGVIECVAALKAECLPKRIERLLSH